MAMITTISKMREIFLRALAQTCILFKKNSMRKQKYVSMFLRQTYVKRNVICDDCRVGLIEKMLDSTITPIFTNEHAKLSNSCSPL